MKSLVLQIVLVCAAVYALDPEPADVVVMDCRATDATATLLAADAAGILDIDTATAGTDGDPSCTLADTGSGDFAATMCLTCCGAAITLSDDLNYIEFSWLFTSTKPEPEPGQPVEITRKGGSDGIRAVCRYDRTGEALYTFTPSVSTVIQTGENEGVFVWSMEYQQMDGTPINNGDDVDVNEDIYADITFERPSEELTFGVTDCTAYDASTAEDSTVSYDLIRNSCGVDDTVVVALQNEDEFKFQFTVFAFVHAQSTLVTLICQVRACEVSDAEAQGCLQVQSQCGAGNDTRRAVDSEFSYSLPSRSFKPVHAGVELN